MDNAEWGIEDPGGSATPGSQRPRNDEIFVPATAVNSFRHPRFPVPDSRFATFLPIPVSIA